MKKKLLFTAYSLDIGGIETALVNLLNRLDYDLYDVTLILEKKAGMYLNLIPDKVEVLEYVAGSNSLLNGLKLMKWKQKLRNKYDFSCSFATYSIPGAQLALAASQNSTLWMHGNYYISYENDKEKMREFLDNILAKEFKRVVFVSEENRRDVANNYEEIKDKSVVCNNFINGKDIILKSMEEVDYERDDATLFVNVGRHDEHQKKLSRIIEASKRLVEDGYNFKVLLIGDGPDSVEYKDLVRKYKLGDVIKFLGQKENPFPYYKMCDAVLLSSEFEGYPVVFLEAMTVGKPIVSTKVSDYEQLDGVYGMFCKHNIDSVYQNMKNFMDNGFIITDKFDYNKYNEEIENKIKSFIEDKD